MKTHSDEVYPKNLGRVIKIVPVNNGFIVGPPAAEYDRVEVNDVHVFNSIEHLKQWLTDHFTTNTPGGE